MKTLSSKIQLLLLAGLVPVVFAIPALAQDGRVTIQNDGIIIHPGTKLSKGDQKALDDVLSHYSTKLYRLERYKGGKLKKGVGELQLDKKTSSEITKASANGLTDCTVIFIGATKTMLPRNLGEDKTAKALTEQLKPILQKYNKP